MLICWRIFYNFAGNFCFYEIINYINCIPFMLFCWVLIVFLSYHSSQIWLEIRFLGRYIFCSSVQNTSLFIECSLSDITLGQKIYFWYGKYRILHQKLQILQNKTCYFSSSKCWLIFIFCVSGKFWNLGDKYKISFQEDISNEHILLYMISC